MEMSLVPMSVTTPMFVSVSMLMVVTVLAIMRVLMPVFVSVIVSVFMFVAVFGIVIMLVFMFVAHDFIPSHGIYLRPCHTWPARKIYRRFKVAYVASYPIRPVAFKVTVASCRMKS
jgi:hypothetical protein